MTIHTLTREHSFPQLKPYYLDFGDELPTSPNQGVVRGLNLLFLLVENLLADFHSELELMGDEERADPCVVFPVRLEQYLMVGSYDQASVPVQSPPARLFLVHALVTSSLRNHHFCCGRPRLLRTC